MMKEDIIRTKKGRLSQIKVVEVNRGNLNAVWPHMLLAIKNASIIAIDLELSGLGDRKKLSAKSVDDRYKAIKNAAQSRSILSLGIATFKLTSLSSKKKRIRFKAQVFNILTICTCPFIVEPEALKFLEKHNFDFNRLISCGISYDSANKKNPISTLFAELLSSSVPITLHNGLVDLVFLYQHLYGPLPEKLDVFLADISDWFPLESPLFDSKFVADYQLRLSTSFLEYFFRKCQRDNGTEAVDNRVYIAIEFDDLSPYSEQFNCTLPHKYSRKPPVSIEDLCFSYSNHGHCHRGNGCEKSHNADLILDLEDQKRDKKRNRRKRRHGEEITNENGSVECHFMNVSKDSKAKYFNIQGCHRAGIDAFMTGFSTLFTSRMSLFKRGEMPEEWANKLPLSGKDISLLIKTSSWAEKSEYHQKMWLSISKNRIKLVRCE